MKGSSHIAPSFGILMAPWCPGPASLSPDEESRAGARSTWEVLCILELRFVRGEPTAPRLLVHHPDVIHLGAATRTQGTARELAIVDPWGNALTLSSE